MMKQILKTFEVINLFQRDKMYNFYSQNNIKYSDVSGKTLNILPVLIIEDKIYLR